MPQNGFDVLLKMIQDTNKQMTELIKITSHNQLAIKIIGVAIFIVATGFVAYYFRNIGS